MSSLFVLRALLFAGECFAASAVLIAFAWAATLLLKRASLRHAVWLAAFGASLAVPVAALIVPPAIVIARTVERMPVYLESAVPSKVAVAEMAPPSFTFGTKELALLLFAAWALGFVWALARLGLGAAGLTALRRQSRPHALASGVLSGTRRAGELRLSEGEEGPLTWGLFKPVVLLPRSAVSWPKERLRAVLLHELAHVRRRDSFTQALALVVCALYWPNPLMWMAARALRREAEIAADDSAIVSGIKPSAYAGELLGLASEFRARRSLAVAMAGPSALEARVKSALAPDRTRTGVGPMDIFKVACFGAAATMLLAFARADVVETGSTLPPVPVAAALPRPLAAPAKLHALPKPVAVADAQDAEPVAAPERAEDAADAEDAEDTVDMSANDDNDTDNDTDTDTESENDTDNVAANSAHVWHDGSESDGDVIVREWRDKNGHRVTMHVSPGTRAEIKRAMAEAKRAQAEVARMKPAIEKAIADAKVQVRVARAMAKAEPRVRAEVARALAKAQPEIDKAIAEARVHVRAALDAHRNVRIEVDGDDMGDDTDNDRDDDEAGRSDER